MQGSGDDKNKAANVDGDDIEVVDDEEEDEVAEEVDDADDADDRRRPYCCAPDVSPVATLST